MGYSVDLASFGQYVVQDSQLPAQLFSSYLVKDHHVDKLALSFLQWQQQVLRKRFEKSLGDMHHECQSKLDVAAANYNGYAEEADKEAARLKAGLEESLERERRCVQQVREMQVGGGVAWSRSFR